jgi:Uncharacterised nucleotidyltransferase
MPVPSNKNCSPEKQLLAYCARTRIDPSTADSIRRLAAGPVEWHLLLREAAEHSVTPLLCRQLPAVASEILESNRLEELRIKARAFAMRNLALTSELLTVVDRLQSAGVHSIPYKGPVLAVQAYGDIALREFEDLDLVLRHRDIFKANDVMINLGYRPKLPGLLTREAASLAPAEYAYFDENRRIMVELHTERTLRHFPSPPDIDDLAARLVTLSVGGQDLRTFSSEDTLILLCIHGSKHFWERLSWITDISEFVQANAIDWGELMRHAEKMRAIRMVNVSLALARQLFDLRLPTEVAGRFQSDTVAASIASSIAESLLARTPISLSGLARFNLRRHMLEGAIEGWRYSIRLATLASDEDWSALRLPRFLTPFYTMLRPFRMLTKYGLSESSSPRESIADRKASNQPN